MELLTSFFNSLWNEIHGITVPIINVHLDAFILGLILISILLDCINKILGKEGNSSTKKG